MHCSGSTLGNCTAPYSRCTKIPFAADNCLRCAEQPCAVSESFIWCKMCYGSSQVGITCVHTAYVHCSGPTSENCTDPYSRITKIPFTADCCERCGEMPLEVSELYTCCTVHYGTSKVGIICVHTGYVHCSGPTSVNCTDSYRRCTKIPFFADGCVWCG